MYLGSAEGAIAQRPGGDTQFRSAGAGTPLCWLEQATARDCPLDDAGVDTSGSSVGVVTGSTGESGASLQRLPQIDDQMLGLGVSDLEDAGCDEKIGPGARTAGKKKVGATKM